MQFCDALSHIYFLSIYYFFFLSNFLNLQYLPFWMFFIDLFFPSKILYFFSSTVFVFWHYFLILFYWFLLSLSLALFYFFSLTLLEMNAYVVFVSLGMQIFKAIKFPLSNSFGPWHKFWNKALHYFLDILQYWYWFPHTL